MNDGQRAGDPILARAGSFELGSVVSDGSLVHESTPSGGEFASWLGEMGPDGRLDGWKPLGLRSSLDNPHAPAWSPDSSQFAYVASNKQAGQDTQSVRVRNVAAGQERELYTGGSGAMFCVWAKMHPYLYCSQVAPQGTTDMLSLSLESGRAERIGSVPGRNHVLFGSANDATLYLGSNSAQLIRWDVATGLTAVLGQGRGTFVFWVTASPDGRWISRVDRGRTEVMSVSGGEWKPLISGGGTEIAFTSDGNWLLYHDLDAAGHDSLFRVATTGGTPERIGDFPASTRFGHMWVSPDGRKVVADTQRAREVWVLENFEPASPKQ
jgi:Tol biopolymer transport system component